MTVRALILGGARSGKSGHAERLADEAAIRSPRPGAASVTYVATGRARADDPEWAARIAEHVQRRPADWRTVESVDLVPILAGEPGVLLIDDLATWLTAVLDDAGCFDGGSIAPVRQRVGSLTAAVAARGAPVVLVSAEVGLGVVPATFSGRLFRDELGRLNAGLAEVCDRVDLLVAGLTLRLR